VIKLKMLLVAKDELLDKSTWLARRLGYPESQTKVVVPEHVMFTLVGRMATETKFEVKLMSQAGSIADVVFDEYPVLVHNRNVIYRHNIWRYLKKVSSVPKASSP
jgi:hypothetical protein